LYHHFADGHDIDTSDDTTSNAKIYGYTILLGTGVGCYCQAGFPVAQVKVAASDIAYSVGFMTVSQMLGIAFGTGMSGAVLSTRRILAFNVFSPAHLLNKFLLRSLV
jgi:hypothetical protein